MQTQVLEQLLAKLDSDSYSIGQYKEHAYCMQKKGANWEVFYGKNSLHLGSRTFVSQEEANKYFYRMLMEKLNQQIINHVDSAQK